MSLPPPEPPRFVIDHSQDVAQNFQRFTVEASAWMYGELLRIYAVLDEVVAAWPEPPRQDPPLAFRPASRDFPREGC